MTPERAKYFRVLADYLARLDRSRPMAPQADPKVSVAGARAWGRGRLDYQALWVMGPKEGYERPVTLRVPTFTRHLAGLVEPHE